MDGDKLLESLLGKSYLSTIANNSLQNDSFIKKVKQEKEDSDDEFSIEPRKRRSTRNDSRKSAKQPKLECADESWQIEVRSLLEDGEATLEDYLLSEDTSLKWIVKHGIRLAITCTSCNIIQHDDESEEIQNHGLHCEKDRNANDSEDAKSEEFVLDVSELPRPFYPDAIQISLRKSLEKNNCTLSDLSGEMKHWPLKYIISKNRKKRGGICIFCGDIFLSTDYKKWVHECWMQDNEVNGFLINEGEYDEILDCSMDEAAKKNPDLLRFLINKTLEPDTKAPTGKPRLNAVHDRSWAYSVRDRLNRGELKEKPIIKDPNYCIRHLIDGTGILIANICINCMRIFSPSINSSNRSRHISVCYLSKNKIIVKQENGEGNFPNSKSSNSPNPTIDKNSGSRSKEAMRLKLLNSHTNFNINLEASIIKTISNDLLHPEIFYQNGMKSFCNRLLQIGFEMGSQRGMGLPTFDQLLPKLETTKKNLQNLVNMDKFKEVFCYVSTVIKDVGGTILIESIGTKELGINEHFVTLSFSIIDELTPKRIVCELITDTSKNSIDDSITTILKKMGLKPRMCNLFVNKKTEKLLQLENFTLQSTCFGDYLNYVAEQVFDNSLTQEHETLTILKNIIDKIPAFFDFLLSKCSISTDIRFILRSEVDGRWFSYSSLVEKLLICVKSYSQQILGSFGKIDDEEKIEMTEFFELATQQFKALQMYNKFVNIFITNIESCAISRRSTLHLVVLKFQFIREKLKTLSEKHDDRIFRLFCALGVNIMEVSEEKFLKKSHFLATLLAPGHRDQLKLYYDEEQILDYENDLIQTLTLHSKLDHSPNTNEDLESEIERYLETEAQTNVDPLEWWSKNGELAPRVNKLAKRLFSIPATSTTIDKTLPPHLSNTQIDEFMRLRILFNWTLNSELQIKKTIKKNKED